MLDSRGFEDVPLWIPAPLDLVEQLVHIASLHQIDEPISARLIFLRSGQSNVDRIGRPRRPPDLHDVGEVESQPAVLD